MASVRKLFILVTFGAFSWLLLLFQLFGFFNFPLKLHHADGLAIGEHRWSSSVWSILHLASAVISGILAKRHYNYLFGGLMLTDAMNNYFKYVIGLLTIFVTVADSWFEVETHRSIWLRYRALATRNGTILGLIGRDELARVLLRYFFAILTIVAVCALVEFTIYNQLTPGTQWHWFWLHNFYPYTFSHVRHVFHLLHISLMASNLRQLQRKLVALHQTGERERLEEYRALYGELWQINEGINELFGFSQACNIASSFAQMAFDLYWVYAMWQKQQRGVELQIFCFVPTPVIIGFLMHAAKKHQLEMDAVQGTVLDMNFGLDAEMVKLRFYFLHQLLRNRIKLTAKDIFDYDYTLIRTLVIVILTYVIIFIEIAD
ncbi:AGAP009858-PA [Anopheles gambiae str. PEST]|uniref:Gustatory receptor n=1 Tax=Anopheles gambiae TaxID=7165 RepID=Q7PK12_ANOGA|nr:AGAP009858-PA [Anopheles gambiae str. PEST]